MNAENPKPLKVGYVPYSNDLDHPADRRRLAAWAVDNGVKLNVEHPLESDILVLSNAANFGHWLSKATQPVILDLVDGYIGENPSFIKDLARNFLRSLKGTSSLKWITYTRHLRAACEQCDAIIVASPEQREAILKYNSSIFVILDDHSELSPKHSSEVDLAASKSAVAPEKYMFWEGFGYTLKHFQLIAKELDSFLVRENWRLYVLTVPIFPRWGGFLGKVNSQALIRKWFPESWGRIEVVPWSLENVERFSSKSEVAIIPIDKNDKFGSLKSENKLLSMWQLGLPVLFSNIPAYSRVANASGQYSFCVDDEQWADAFDSLLEPRNLLGFEDEGRRLYLNQFHTHEILMNKWSSVIEKYARVKLEGFDSSTRKTK
jgi:hypothetical protein